MCTTSKLTNSWDEGPLPQANASLNFLEKSDGGENKMSKSIIKVNVILITEFGFYAFSFRFIERIAAAEN